MHAVPGGPYSNDATCRRRSRRISRKVRVESPNYEQYWHRLREVAHGDFGPSQKLLDFNVNDVIRQGLPVSACLGILALTLP